MKVYDGSGPMRIAVFFSGGASSGEAIMESPGHGKKYQTVCAVTNNGIASAIGMYHNAKIPLIYENPDGHERGEKGRESFYEEICRKMEGFEPDVLAFSGWTGKKSIVSDPLFTEYRNRAFNVHPAYLGLTWKKSTQRSIGKESIDLGRLPSALAMRLMENDNLTRKFIGEDAVFAAMLMGELYSASTVFALKEGCDDGPCIVRSVGLTFDSGKVARWIEQMDFRALRKYADEHQEGQKWKCDGPVFVRVMELAAERRLDVDIETMEVQVDGELAPYGGFVLGEDI